MGNEPSLEIAGPAVGAEGGSTSTVLNQSPVIPVVLGSQEAKGSNPVAVGENTLAANTTVETNPVARGDNPVAAVTTVTTDDINSIKGDLTKLRLDVEKLVSIQNTATQDASPVTFTATPVESNNSNTMICMPGAPAHGDLPNSLMTHVVSAQPDAATFIASTAGAGMPGAPG